MEAVCFVASLLAKSINLSTSVYLGLIVFMTIASEA